MTSVHNSNDVRVFRKECVSLAKREDFDVYLIAPGEDREEAGVHVIGIGEVPASRLKRMRETTKIVYERALALDADLYHFHDPELLPYGAKLARQGRHVIFDSHENTVEQIRIKPYIPAPMRGPAASVYLHRENRYVRGLDAVIFPCPVKGKHPFAGRAKKNVYINNTPMLEELYDRYRSEDRDPGRQPAVCHVGSLTHARGITHLIDACYQAGVRLILAGDFSPAGYLEELQAKESWSCVDWRGYCSRDEVFDIYMEATIGASTLLKVGQYVDLGNLPTKVYEYMAMGLPTLLTDFPYGKEANAEHRFAMTTDPEDVEEMADKIRYLIDHPALAQELAENGRQAIKEHFNWGLEEQELYRLYDEILSSDQ